MSRIDALNRRYAASSILARTGVEILAVGEPAGARLNVAAGRLMIAARDDGPGLWDELVGAVKSLRWRLATHPQPIEYNPALRDAALEVIRQSRRLRNAVANDLLLDELSEAAVQISETDPALGTVLLRSVHEVGPSDCVVVASSTRASAAMSYWLRASGIKVLTASDPEYAAIDVEQTYAVGPPRFFHSSLVTAPVTSAVSFVMPAWFPDRRIPTSAIAPYADGAIHIKSRVFLEGDLTEPDSRTEDEAFAEEDYLPQPAWGRRQSPNREPSSDEVEARKVLLSGSFALWLDDGDRIRTVDPRQPSGERVSYTEVPSVRPGTYLLLRHGQTEHRALHEAALSRLGDRGTTIEESQQLWKQRLQTRLNQLDRRTVSRELRNRGVKTADRAYAWSSPTLVRPNNDHDFEQLLEWLGMPLQPSFGNATLLRRAIYQLSAEIREQLERAISASNMTALERDGHLRIEAEESGFRGILATRVLAVSLHTEIVSRYDVRVPFEDRSGQWLE